MSIKNFLFLSITILFNSCLLFIDDDHITNVPNIADPSNKSILLYSYRNYYDGRNFYPVKDTVWLDTQIRLKVNNAYHLRALINGVEIYKGNNTEFDLKRDNRPDGTYKLTLIQQVKSGTGSLADNLDLEYAEYTEDFVLIIGVQDFKVDFNVALKDNSVEVSWKPFPMGNFQSYEVWKYYDKGGWDGKSSSAYRILKVSDVNQTSLLDTTYVGGKIWYEFRINIGDGYLKDIKEVEFPYNPDLTLEKIGENKLRLSWKKPEFYKNIDHYTVLTGYERGGEPLNILGDKLSVDKQYFEFETPTEFFEFKYYNVKLNAKVDNAKNEDAATFGDYLVWGKKLPYIYKALYDPINKVYYALAYSNLMKTMILRLDKNLNLLDSTVYSFNIFQPNFEISPDSKFIFIGGHFTIYKISVDNLALVDQFNSGGYLSKSIIKALDSELVMYGDLYTIYIMDFKIKEIVFLSTKSYLHDVTNNRNYLIMGNTLYHFNGHTYDEIKFFNYSSQIKFVKFIQNQNTLLLYLEDRIILYDYVNDVEVKDYDVGYLDYNSPWNFIPYVFFDQETLNLSTTRKNGDKIYIDILNIVSGNRSEFQLGEVNSIMMAGNSVFFNFGSNCFAHSNLF